jgi:hypothetical protein
VQSAGDRDLRSPPDREGNPIRDGQRLLSAWSETSLPGRYRCPLPNTVYCLMRETAGVSVRRAHSGWRPAEFVDMAKWSKAPDCKPGISSVRI